MHTTPRTSFRRAVRAGLWLALTALAIVACQQQTLLPPVDAIGEGDTIEYAFGASGEVREIVLPGPSGPFSFSYEVIDGLAIVEGDMVLGDAQELEDLAAEADAIDLIGPEGSVMTRQLCWRFLGIDFHCEYYRWPNATVPYTFADDWDDPAMVGDENGAMRVTILAAIDAIEAVTAVRFVPRTSQDDYVRFRNGDGCSSYVGRQGGRQDIKLALGCNNTWIVVHEVMHALGFNHEQSRDDRGGFVQIQWDNIRDGKRHNFEVADYSWDYRPYDFDSLMHYGANDFCKRDAADACVGPTIITVPAGTAIGQRSRMSTTDIAGINRIYPGEPPTIDITGPTAGTSYNRRASNIFFTADVVDPEDGDVTVTWTSNVDGLLGSGNPFTYNTGPLTYGAHTVTARVVDLQGNAATDTVAVTIVNNPPTVDIDVPLPGDFCVGEPIAFGATVVDINEVGSTLPDASVEWSVSGTTFATGKNVVQAFGAPGNFLVVVSAADDQGASASDSVNVGIVDCSDQPPTVAISSPADEVELVYHGFDEVRDQWFRDVTFIGSANDPEDGALTGGDLVWTTNYAEQVQLQLGTGANLTTRLYSSTCTGVTHTITLTATDSFGNVRTDVVRVFIWTLC